MKILTAAFMLLVASIASSYAAIESEPDALARSVTDAVLMILKSDKSQAASSRNVMQLVESKIVPYFDFARMTQLAAGRNWRDATPEQQKALTDEFRMLLVRTYATAIALYTNQTIEYRLARTTPTDPEAIVKSLIRQPTGQSIAVDYSMTKATGDWKVYDVKIEGVSLVTSYRGSFNTEIQKNGIDGLIKALSSKNYAASVAGTK